MLGVVAFGALAGQANASLYWVPRASGTVVRANLDGTGPTTIASGQPFPQGVAVSGRHLYWATQQDSALDPNSGTIVKANLDGTNATPIVTGQSLPYGVAASSTHLYWVTNTLVDPDHNGTVVEANLDGTNATPIATGQAHPIGVAVSNSHLYWANFGGGTIVEANLDGTNATPIATGQSFPAGVAVNGSHLYWTSDQPTLGTVVEANLDGTNPKTIATGQTFPIAVAADDSHLYWATESVGGASHSGSIVEANLDGTNPTPIATGLDAPDGLAVQTTVPPKATPSIATTASASPVRIGQPISDSATVTGGDDPSGTVTFELFANDTCSGTPAFISAGRPLSAGTAHSTSFTPMSAGTLRWVAIYSGDTNNNSVSTPCPATVTVLAPGPVKLTARISSKRHRASFIFRATGASGFQCALVKSPQGKHANKPRPRYVACTSPKTYTHLKRGRYVFDVRTISAGAITGPAATRRFKIN
jgi:hypothetical protein